MKSNRIAIEGQCTGHYHPIAMLKSKHRITKTTTRYKLYNESRKDENFITDAITNLTSNEGKGSIIPSVAVKKNL
jgi:hypothetical protein